MARLASIMWNLDRVSIAGMTPSSSDKAIGKYAGRIMTLDYNYRDLPMSYGVEIYKPSEFKEKSSKYKLIKYLSEHGVATELHVKDRALEDLYYIEEFDDSKIKKVLETLPELDRVILDINEDNFRGEDFDPERASDLAFFLQGLGSSNNFNKKLKTVMLRGDEKTELQAQLSLEAHLRHDDVRRQQNDIGVLLCPGQATPNSYQGFKSLNEYDVIKYVGQHRLDIDFKAEQTGGIGSTNAGAALRQMIDVGTHHPSITMTDGVMTNKRLDFEKVQTALDQIRQVVKEYS